MAIARNANSSTSILLPDELVAVIDEIVGMQKRESFIEDALKETVRRKRLRAALDEMAGSLADVDIPGWETPESTSQWVRDLRYQPDKIVVTDHDE